LILSPNGDVGAEQKARFAAERGRNKREERRLDTRLLTIADAETLTACALGEERGTVIPVISDALDELLDRERERHKSELVSARQSPSSKAAAGALATERGKVLDLPNPLKREKWAACRLWGVERKPSARS
jgi:hypothetical protein